MRTEVQLTDKQRKVLEVIQVYLQRYGVGPTMDEIAEDAGLGSGAAALWHVRALERKGYVERGGRPARKGNDRHWSRNMTIVDRIDGSTGLTTE
jgi:SOS-response transcriptional repressor LexA